MIWQERSCLDEAAWMMQKKAVESYTKQYHNSLISIPSHA